MADFKISERSAAGAITGDEIIGLIQSGGDVQSTIDDIKDYISAGGGSSVVTDKVSLSSAEILDLFNTPKVIVAAQGAGTLIQPLFLTMRLNYNSVTYATNVLLQLLYTGGSAIATSTIIGNSALALSRQSTTTSMTFLSSLPTDTDLIVNIQTGNPTAGNSTLDIYITYTVITL